MGYGRITINKSILRNILLLPDNYKIEAVYENYTYRYFKDQIGISLTGLDDTFSIIVSSTDIPDIKEEQPLPRINPIYERHNDQIVLSRIKIDIS